MNANDDTRAKEQAKVQLESVVEMLTAYDKAEKEGQAEYNGEDMNADDMREAIEQDALSVEVRTDWRTPGGEDDKPTEYKITLCTGGPAVRIVGDLSEHGEPEGAVLQYQDWGTPWTDYRETSGEEDAALLRYAGFFYFGG